MAAAAPYTSLHLPPPAAICRQVLPPVATAGTPSRSKGMLRCDLEATPPTAQAQVLTP